MTNEGGIFPFAMYKKYYMAVGGLIQCTNLHLFVIGISF
jgi:hypothetical protein